jgi:ribosomal protein S18 acetylase RimI-like enzyme
MAVTIRNALDQEFDKIASLNVEAYGEYAQALAVKDWEIMRTNLSNVAAIASSQTSQMKGQVGQVIVAQQALLLAGAVIYCPPGASDSRIFQPEWASLRLLAVLPQQRSRGIGKQLTLECIRRAKQDGAEIMALHTNKLMLAAQKLYEQLGFKREIELPSHFGLQYWRYVLNLRKPERKSERKPEREPERI